ncbi:MAG: biopolymer transporter ExbD [Alphaproteobacteria bacterium]|nr:biopolymer transporter ExbD [Alphaproteobacteria bacterium]MCB9695532.1 biopolymer transporter ExbD [Alphaproteobacteria bacterium]
MSRRGHHELEDEAAESGELNLTPYLDIITTLVIFLIFTFQVVIEFRLIDLMPPAYGSSARNPSDNPDKKPEVTLTLFIHSQGYKLVTNQPELGAVEVKLKSGEYDNEKLTQELEKVKRTLQMGESLIITASDDIEYRTVVAAMDAAREYEGRMLFPDVLLARASTGGG